MAASHPDRARRVAIPRQRGLPPATQDALWEAALEVLAAKGVARATVEEVAERAGISRATVYYHFRSKRDLLAFLLHHGLALMAAEVERAARRAGGTAEALEAIIDAHVDFFWAHQPFTQVVLSETWQVDRSHTLDPRALLAGDVAVVGEVLARARREGLIKESLDVELLTVSLFGLVSSAAVYFATYRRRFPRQRIRRALKTVFLQGALARAPAASGTTPSPEGAQ